MPKSEIAKKVTKAINAIEKLLTDIQKDGKKAIEALKELGEEKKD